MLSPIFHTAVEAAEAFALCINLGIEPGQAKRLVFSEEPTPCPAPVAKDWSKCGRDPEEPAHIRTFCGVYVNHCFMGESF
jgi:hypothetical protein